MDLTEKRLTRGQVLVLAAAAVPMVVFGALGGWGTYTNITTVFHRSATALGVVAAGEGATLVLALVLVGLTMLGQPSPAPVRIGLWTLPAVASLTGAVTAETVTEAVVYAVTPMAMCVSAEGMGLLARRIVIYRTGVDAEAQRRNAEVMQKLAYHRAQAANHPDGKVRKRSELRSWKLAAKVGIGDTTLGAGLVQVQRERMTAGADAALGAMFDLPASRALDPAETVETPAETGETVAETGGTSAETVETVAETGGTRAETPGVSAVSPGDTQVTAMFRPEIAAAETLAETVETLAETVETLAETVAETGETVAETGETVAEAVETVAEAVETLAETSAETGETVAETGVSLAEVAAVAGIEMPETGVSLTDDQLVVVLRYLRHQDTPPMSYRQALVAFRDAGFVGSEGRVRRAWGLLVSGEEVDA